MQKSDRPLAYILMCSDSSPALINKPYISRRSNDQALRQTENLNLLQIKLSLPIAEIKNYTKKQASMADAF